MSLKISITKMAIRILIQQFNSLSLNPTNPYLENSVELWGAFERAVFSRSYKLFSMISNKRQYTFSRSLVTFLNLNTFFHYKSQFFEILNNSMNFFNLQFSFQFSFVFFFLADSPLTTFVTFSGVPQENLKLQISMFNICKILSISLKPFISLGYSYEYFF